MSVQITTYDGRSLRGATVESLIGTTGIAQSQHVLFSGQGLDLQPGGMPVALRGAGETAPTVIPGSLSAIAALVVQGDMLPPSLQGGEPVGLWDGSDSSLLADIRSRAIAVSSSVVIMRVHGVDDAGLPDGRVAASDSQVDAIVVVPTDDVLRNAERVKLPDSARVLGIMDRSGEVAVQYGLLAIEEHAAGAIDHAQGVGRLVLKGAAEIVAADTPVGLVLCDPRDLSVSIVAHNRLSPDVFTGLIATSAVGPKVRDVPREFMARLRQ